jgi:hypothetical protein
MVLARLGLALLAVPLAAEAQESIPRTRVVCKLLGVHHPDEEEES